MDLGKWVIESALIQIESWNQENFITIISVNISAYHLLHPSFVSQLVELLKKYPSVNPNQLELEVLETAAMSDINCAIDVLAQCKALGLYISLDDFGTGYSSLSYLKKFPIDTIKIDKSFISDLMYSEEDRKIVNSIIQLAHNLGLKVTAEGAEELDQILFLKKLGCEEVQGFYYCKPLAGEEYLAFLAKSINLFEIE